MEAIDAPELRLRATRRHRRNSHRHRSIRNPRLAAGMTLLKHALTKLVRRPGYPLSRSRDSRRLRSHRQRQERQLQRGNLMRRSMSDRGRQLKMLDCSFHEAETGSGSRAIPMSGPCRPSRIASTISGAMRASVEERASRRRARFLRTRPVRRWSRAHQNQACASTGRRGTAP